MERDPEKIILPLQSDYFEWSLANSSALQAAMMNYTGQISYQLPSHPLIKLGSQVRFGQKQLSQLDPVEGPTVFMDGSGKTGKAAIVWKDGSQWRHKIEHQEGSPQVVELRAMAMVFQNFPGPVNIITDSAYVAGLVQRLDKAVLGHGSNETLFRVLKLLWLEIQKRHYEYYVMHIKSHTTLPGVTVEGNAKSDALVSAMALGPVPDIKQQAIASHCFYHQGYRALKRQFHISNSEARAIIAVC
ncbi:POK19 protein, partial [Glareola pratincola]|nr:POK19 protein [Glareola pratincola]